MPVLYALDPMFLMIIYMTLGTLIGTIMSSSR